MPIPRRTAPASRAYLPALAPLALLALLAAAALPHAAAAQPAPLSPAQVAAQMRALGYDPDSVFFAFQVQEPARPAPGARGPVYPPALKAAGTEGDVLLAFVVDTSGRAVPNSVRVLRSAHGLFTEAARAALDSMTFVPARLRGRAVRQLVQQPFQFRLPK